MIKMSLSKLQRASFFIDFFFAIFICGNTCFPRKNNQALFFLQISVHVGVLLLLFFFFVTSAKNKM